uniref:C2H2-type domain-containing protein n=1 Tax=Soboliphyme baturini TaxID=241478 RepID=A0A183IHN4_9BILA
MPENEHAPDSTSAAVSCGLNAGGNSMKESPSSTESNKGVFPAFCSFCRKSYRTTKKLYMHCLEAHNQDKNWSESVKPHQAPPDVTVTSDSGAPAVSRAEQTYDGTIVCCEKCSKHFSSTYFLNIHQATRHSVTEESGATDRPVGQNLSNHCSRSKREPDKMNSFQAKSFANANTSYASPFGDTGTRTTASNAHAHGGSLPFFSPSSFSNVYAQLMVPSSLPLIPDLSCSVCRQLMLIFQSHFMMNHSNMLLNPYNVYSNTSDLGGRFAASSSSDQNQAAAAAAAAAASWLSSVGSDLSSYPDVAGGTLPAAVNNCRIPSAHTPLVETIPPSKLTKLQAEVAAANTSASSGVALSMSQPLCSFQQRQSNGIEAMNDLLAPKDSSSSSLSCNLCVRSFPSLFALIAHRYREHGSFDSSLTTSLAALRSASTTVPQSVDPDSFCDICKKEFCSKYFLRTHMFKVHGIVTETSPGQPAGGAGAMHGMIIDENKVVVANVNGASNGEGLVAPKQGFRSKVHKKSTPPVLAQPADDGSSSLARDDEGSAADQGWADECAGTKLQVAENAQASSGASTAGKASDVCDNCDQETLEIMPEELDLQIQCDGSATASESVKEKVDEDSSSTSIGQQASEKTDDRPNLRHDPQSLSQIKCIRQKVNRSLTNYIAAYKIVRGSARKTAMALYIEQPSLSAASFGLCPVVGNKVRDGQTDGRPPGDDPLYRIFTSRLRSVPEDACSVHARCSSCSRLYNVDGRLGSHPSVISDYVYATWAPKQGGFVLKLAKTVTPSTLTDRLTAGERFWAAPSPESNPEPPSPESNPDPPLPVITMNDKRPFIQLSNFGFLAHGYFYVQVANLTYPGFEGLSANDLIGFTFSKGDELPEAMNSNPNECFLEADDEYSAMLFLLDFGSGEVHIRYSGTAMNSLPLCFNKEVEDCVRAYTLEGVPFRSLNQSANDGAVRFASVQRLQIRSAPVAKGFPSTFKLPKLSRDVSAQRTLINNAKTTKLSNDNGMFSFEFAVPFPDSAANEGEYWFIFHNCRNNRRSFFSQTGVTFTVTIVERNEHSYLSAGEIFRPTLYFVLAALFLLAGVAWVYVLHRERYDIISVSATGSNTLKCRASVSARTSSKYTSPWLCLLSSKRWRCFFTGYCNDLLYAIFVVTATRQHDFVICIIQLLQWG